jgi:bisphosphoglycerate-independent phosphoglycerate mutase (AlkP superfamily)
MTGNPKVLRFLEDEDKEDRALRDVAPTVLDIMGLKTLEGVGLPFLDPLIVVK